MRTAIVIALCCLTALGAKAQNNFSIEVSPSQIKLGEAVLVNIVLSGYDGSIIAPNFDDCEITTGPIIRSSYQYATGSGSSSVLTHSYRIRPLREGVISIGPAQAQTSSGTITSNSVEIEVEAAADDSKILLKDSLRAPHMPRGYALITIPNKTAAILGEVIRVDYYLYSEFEGLSVINYDLLPGHPAFLTSNVLNDNAQWEFASDQSFKRAHLGTQYLIPQSTGYQKLAPYEISVEIPRGIWGTDLRTVGTLPSSIAVSPLPDGATTAFYSGIGEFQISSTITSDSIWLGQAFEIELTVQGEGNILMIEAPEVEVPDGMDIFPPVMTEDVKVSGSSMLGKKEFSYTVNPQRGGEQVIPAIPFQYYDPEVGDYVMKYTDEMRIYVHGGETSEDAEEESDQDEDEASTKIRVSDWPWKYISLGVGILFLFILFMVWLRRPLQKKALAARSASELASTYFDQAQSNIKAGKMKEAHSAIYQGMNQFMSRHMGIAMADLNKERLVAELSQSSIPEQRQKEWLEAMEQCEMAAYAAAMMEDSSALLSKVRALVNSISRH